ncbi:MAG: hypothetical protein AAGD05_16450, partial [Bacteroidota bacterium]
MKKLLLFTGLLLWSSLSFAQVVYTANDTVPSYEHSFLLGSNMGYYPPWQDEQLADIAAGNARLEVEGLGIQTLRPALPAFFLETWGYENRLPAFEHYASLGLKDLTAFIGYPAELHRDTQQYCPGHPSELFANLYEDIWDNGANGTPINDNNHYAVYLYKMVPLYKDYVRFWEIWNEPDFDLSSKGWRPPGMEGNWWDNNPAPCDYHLRAPIFHYIRLLRISYEVIKFLDPDAYVAVGGLGYPSFLDAILRNTDHPLNGTPSNLYPLKGGAYFDCLSFHTYPHINGSLRYWDNDRGGFVYTRHSDAAVDGVLNHQQEFQDVLFNHGYDDQSYPQKIQIITECNIPRMAFEDYIGSDEAQRNFLLKTLIACHQHDIRQFHVYDLGEKKQLNQATSSFDVMGLYESLNDAAPYTQIPTPGGIAYKTAAQLLSDHHFDPIQTDRLALPDGIRGGAFQHSDGTYLYALWAATQTDQSEAATAYYDFPSILGIDEVERYAWDFG